MESVRDAPRTRDEEAEQEGRNEWGYDETHRPDVELVHKRMSESETFSRPFNSIAMDSPCVPEGGTGTYP